MMDGSRRSSRCKPGVRNFGVVAIEARKRELEFGSGKKCCWRESAYRKRRRFRNTTVPYKDDEEERGDGVTLAVLLTRVVAVRSVPGRS